MSAGLDDGVAVATHDHGGPVVLDPATPAQLAAARQGLEAILFVASDPVPVDALARALELDVDVVERLLDELGDELTRAPRGYVLRHVAGGWRLSSHPDAAPYVEQFVLDGRAGRLTPAALETLAIIAYKQPISRAEVGEVRGVSADGAVRSLVQRGFVREVGRSEAPGQPILFGTTGLFLEQLGLASLDDLPPLTEYLTETAPDEPATGDLRAARSRIASGEDLAATGAPTWDPTSRAAALVAAVQGLREAAADDASADDPDDEAPVADAGDRGPAAADATPDAQDDLASTLTALVRGLDAASAPDAGDDAHDDLAAATARAEHVVARGERLASLRTRRSEREAMADLAADLDAAADAAMAQVDAALEAVRRDAVVAAGEDPDAAGDALDPADPAHPTDATATDDGRG